MHDLIERINNFYFVFFCIIFTTLSLATNYARIKSNVPFIQSNPGGHVIHTAIALSKGEGLANNKFKLEDLKMKEISKNTLGINLHPDMYSIGLDGKLYPKHPILISALAVPFYIIGDEIAVWIFSQLILFSFFLAILIFSKEYSNCIIAFCLVLFSMVFSKLILINCTGLSWDVLGAAFVSWAFIFKKWKYKTFPYILLALSCYLRMTHLFFLPFLLYFPWKGKIELNFYDFFKFAFFLAPLLVFQWHIWGTPFTGPYSNLPHYFNGEMFFTTGLKGHKFSFYNLVNFFDERLFFGKHSILKWIPSLLILPFLQFFTFRRKELFNDLQILWLASIGYILLFLAYEFWEGSYGFRFVYPSYVLFFAILASSIQTAFTNITRKNNVTTHPML